MTEISEFVLVERPACSRDEWTEVRFHGNEHDCIDSTHAQAPSHVCEAHQAAVSAVGEMNPSLSDEQQERDMLLRLQKELDEQSLAKFLAAENAASSDPARCECLGGNHGVHRPTCRFHV